jgi:catechol 2,3-dioxygenase-like lactoylglutathione lyase family enzyme
VSLPRIDHIGIIVGDLEAAVGRFSAVLGGLVPQRRDLPDVGLRIAEFHTDNLAIELIAYDGDARFARTVMGSEPGINHITVAVEDVPSAIERLGAAGFKAQPGFPRAGAHGTVAFFERDTTTGLLFEVCAPHASKDAT